MKVRATNDWPEWLTKGKVYEAVLLGDNYSLVGDNADYGTGSFPLNESWSRGLLEPVIDAAPMILPTDPATRKGMPIATGVVDYFPLALAEVAIVSKAGNDQHNPGQPLHWAKGKSTDHADTLMRHLIDRGSRDVDGMRHSAKLAWRALALLQTELEAEQRGE